MRELSSREHLQQMKRDEVTAFCFARHEEIDRRRLLFSWDNVRKRERNAIMPLFYNKRRR